ncbi:MAG: ABC transporter permease subunit [Dethiobacteria bacterium]|jgi:branched-chain amino acid transport system permease protein
MGNKVLTISNRWKEVLGKFRIGRVSRIFGIMLLICAACFPLITQNPYFIRIGVMVFIYYIVALCYDLTLNMTNLFSLGFIMYMALGGYVGALLTLHTELSFWMVLLLSVIISSLISALCHIPMLRFRGDYLCLVGLAIAEIFRLIVSNWLSLTRGPMGLPGIESPKIFNYVFQTATPFYYLAGACVLLCLIIMSRIKYSQVGLAFRAIKYNEEGARACGVNVDHYRHLCMLLGAIPSAAAGCIFAHFLGFIDPSVAQMSETTNLLTMVILGGGHPIGLFLSTLVLTTLPELLKGFLLWRMWILGLFFIFFMNARPEGLSTGFIKHFRAPKENLEGRKRNCLVVDRMPHSGSREILEARSVVKRFGGLVAVNKVNMKLKKGEILAVIGPNGAGKTTFFNMIAGTYSPSEGDILLEGKPIAGLPTHTVARSGIARTFQNINICDQLTVLDNVLISLNDGVFNELGRAFMPARFTEKTGEDIDFAMTLLRYVGLQGREELKGGALPYADQRRLEIARALARRPKILLADEPSAGMNPEEAVQLMELLRDLNKKGVTIMLIEHNMNVAMGISDRVIVLNNGMKIAEGSPKDILNNDEVIKAYLGDGYESA